MSLISIQLNLHDDSKLELEDEAPLWRIYHWYIEYNKLVGGLEHFLLFHILGIIIPIDKYFFRGVETTNQVYNILYIYHIQQDTLWVVNLPSIWISCKNFTTQRQWNDGLMNYVKFVQRWWHTIWAEATSLLTESKGLPSGYLTVCHGKSTFL
jgi:hypothetical protein